MIDDFDHSHNANYQFLAMRIYMKMVERLLLFIHASRSKNWSLHISAGENLVMGFVANDRINYRRIMPVYLAEMRGLEVYEPEIWKYLSDGHFSVTKSKMVDFMTYHPMRTLELDCY